MSNDEGRLKERNRFAKSIDEQPPREFIKTLKEVEAEEHASDRAFRRRIVSGLAVFLMAAFAATLWLIYSHSAGSIQLPPEMITAIAWTCVGEITGLLGVIVANLFRKI